MSTSMKLLVPGDVRRRLHLPIDVVSGFYPHIPYLLLQQSDRQPIRRFPSNYIDALAASLPQQKLKKGAALALVREFGSTPTAERLTTETQDWWEERLQAHGEFSVKEATELLGISERTIFDWEKQKKLRALRRPPDKSGRNRGGGWDMLYFTAAELQRVCKWQLPS
jgi:hypothetical protein